ncbi:MAG: glycerol-3-phosphate 1-O-acyltransferase PlsY [Acidobacteria bacterium]|nr:glycerol-3-phosphate 1-O-acyltransferase PlsY [Acidobacteriota bacterium]MBI3655508.1 glycerol-3-phosphate 1-O-acyltransferase PlsY [Acidobacteriota bacterium]
MHHLLILMGAYFLGAIPFGYMIVRLTQGGDIRQVGSGNIGATNVFRSASKMGGVATLLLDAAKGYLAVLLARKLLNDPTRSWEVAAAVLAIVGHIFTIFLKFKGGKGVAVGCGAYMAISPMAGLASILVFVVVMGISRYVSLGSIMATLAYPLSAYWFDEPKVVILGGGLGALLIIAKHHANIRRLFTGREHRLAASHKPS